MNERCYKCFKPKSNCLCKYTKEINTGIKFVFLMHPKEAKRQRSGTGILSHISLKNSEIIVGLEFEKNERLQELFHDDKYFPVMMYPGDEPWTAKKEGFSDLYSKKTLLVLILDATWFCAKKIIQHNAFLLDLPRVSFYNQYESIFTFKKEPQVGYVSTIETCYYLIKELQEQDLLSKEIDPSPLLVVFKEMIKLQLQAENERILGIRENSHSYEFKDTKLKEDRTIK